MRALLLATVAAAMVGCATQATTRPARVALADCASLPLEEALTTVYSPGAVTHVVPRYRQETFGRGAILPRHVSGADLYVSAQPGVTRGYLERALVCHAASEQALSAKDPLHAPGQVSVSVSEAGPSMRIAVTGESRATGRTILERARALQAGGVSVEQISSAPALPRF